MTAGVAAGGSTCGNCRAPLTPGGNFCGACGAPVAAPTMQTYDPPPVPPPGPRADWRPPPQVLPAPVQGGPYRSGPPRTGGGRTSRPALIAGAVAAVVIVGGGATAVALGLGSGDRAASPTVPTATPAPVSVAAPPTLSTGPLPSVPPSTVAAAPADLLRQQLDADAPEVETLVGKWIPQLSSKREGDVVAGTRYDAAAVLADFRSWQERVPTSVLTRSERFTSFRGRDYWVTLAVQPFDSAAAANAWCASQGLPAADCFAKRLSHTEGPAGNTKPR